MKFFRLLIAAIGIGLLVLYGGTDLLQFMSDGGTSIYVISYYGLRILVILAGMFSLIFLLKQGARWRNLIIITALLCISFFVFRGSFRSDVLLLEGLSETGFSPIRTNEDKGEKGASYKTSFSLTGYPYPILGNYIGCRNDGSCYFKASLYNGKDYREAVQVFNEAVNGIHSAIGYSEWSNQGIADRTLMTKLDSGVWFKVERWSFDSGHTIELSIGREAGVSE